MTGAEAWRADFIGSGTEDPQLLRGTFEVRRDVRRALLHTTARGAYDVEVNGTPLDDAELKPGWTSYQWRLNAEVHDVTAHLRRGANAIGIVLTGGWYTERFGFRDAAWRFYQGPPAAAAQLVLEYDDGTEETITTGERWRHAPGPVVAASIYQGETYDARRQIPDWSHPDLDDADWAPVSIVDGPDVVPTVRSSPPVRVIEHLPVQQVLTTPSGRTVLDFGQNLVGRLRIRVRGERGHTITLRHAEVLENGELGVRPLRNAAATDHYTLAGDGEETWEPRWTFHGFRYAEIENWPGELTPDRVDGRRAAQRHAQDRRLRHLTRVAATVARQRRLEHAGQLPVDPHRLPATRRAARLDRRPPGVRPDRVLPLRLRRVPPLLARRRHARTTCRGWRRPHVRAGRDPAVARRVRPRRGLGRRDHRRAHRALGTLRRPGRVANLLRGDDHLGGPDRGPSRHITAVAGRLPVR